MTREVTTALPRDDSAYADAPVTPVLVFGVHQANEAYPNTLFRIEGLKACSRFLISEINIPFRMPPWSSRRSRWMWLIGGGGGLIWSHLRLCLRYFGTPKCEKVYIPYPAVFILLGFSLLRSPWRPSCVVADVFLSLYDTLVNDRELLRADGLLARILYRIEGRAYRTASLLIADTPENADYVAKTFSLDPKRIVALPLATDECRFRFVPYSVRGEACRVVFVGTMVPLQGIRTIIAAAKIVREDPRIRIKIIGDGQDGMVIEEALRAQPDLVEWERRWHSADKVAEAIAQADICLGIFGSGPKTQRVCPLKLYAYLAIGRAVITADTVWSRNAIEQAAEPPFHTVPAGDPIGLASAIAMLASDAVRRIQLAAAARSYYESRLANEISDRALEMLLVSAPQHKVLGSQ